MRLKTKATRMLITAGPTREYIDPVRYISNVSSGKMGFALAKAAHELGGDVTLIAGHVDRETPKGVKGIAVTTARHMHKAALREAKKADIIIMAAAVADWRPKGARRAKMKRSAKSIKLEMVPNPDILADLCMKKKDGQTIVGFALETGDLERNARRKLKKKGCDWIVANKVSAIGADVSGGILIRRDGKKIRLPRLPKEDLAVVILSHVMC